MRAGSLGDRGRRVRRLGAAVGGRVQRGDEFFPGTRQQVVDRGAAHQVCIHLVLPRLVQPRLLRRHLLLGLAQIDDAGLPVARFAPGAFVHATPETQAFQRQRDLALVASHGAAPAPVAAGLLAADRAFFAQHDAVPLLGQEQRGGYADDAATDDHHAGAWRKCRVGDNGIDGWRHATILLIKGRGTWYRRRGICIAPLYSVEVPSYLGARIRATVCWCRTRIAPVGAMVAQRHRHCLDHRARSGAPVRHPVARPSASVANTPPDH